MTTKLLMLDTKLQRSADRIAATLQQTQSTLLSLMTVESVLARIELDMVDPDEQADVIDAFLQAQRHDGSWHGSLLRTAETLLLLRSLGAPRSKQIDRACRWLLVRANTPGRFGACCTPALHAVGLCCHFASGFFAPAPASVTLDGLRLESGYLIGSDQDARIAASALACAALLEWGDTSSLLRVHTDANCRILHLVPAGAFVMSPIAFCCVLRAAIAAGGRKAPDEAVLVAVHHLTRSQRPDGSWAGIDLFAVVETLLVAHERGHDQPALFAALRRVAALLVGGHGVTSGHALAIRPYRTHIAWRLLRCAAGEPLAHYV